MKKAFLASSVAALLLASASYAQQLTTTKDQLVGTWRVQTLTATSGDKDTHPLGEQPSGYLIMTPELLFVDATRKASAAPTLTNAEAAEIMKTQVAWTGQYSTGEQTADGIKVTAHVDTSSSQTIAGHDRVCFMRLDGNKMTAESLGVVVPMTSAPSIAEFELLRSD